MEPKIAETTQTSTCIRCGRTKSIEDFAATKSPFYADNHIPICNTCLEDYLRHYSYAWQKIDKVCQYIDIPFIPKEFEKIHEENSTSPFEVYAKIFAQKDYEGLHWEDYFKEFEQLKQRGYLDYELPAIGNEKRRLLREKWGFNYDDEALLYLEHLYSGMMATQNVNGALQVDQALKICKISYAVDGRIQEGAEIDKMLSAYERLVKIADFTPKNVKNANDFESIGELVKWLEKRGFKNLVYDNVTRDVVDETIKNIQSNNQRLYTNESGIGDEITRRINALKNYKEEESYYDVSIDDDDYDPDAYEVEVFAEQEDDNFDANIDGETV